MVAINLLVTWLVTCWEPLLGERCGGKRMKVREVTFLRFITTEWIAFAGFSENNTRKPLETSRRLCAMSRIKTYSANDWFQLSHPETNSSFRQLNHLLFIMIIFFYFV